MNAPQLSVVLPVYNVDKLLPECLDSIRAQSFTEWEAILVDDGSTDFSGVICDSFARLDPRFKVIHQRNSGVSAARNAGIDASASPLLTFVDPDDFVSPNYFQELVSALQRIDADVAISSCHLVEQNGKVGSYSIANKIDTFITSLPENAAMTNNQEVINALCNGFFSVSSWGKLFRRDLWGNALFPMDTDLGEDVEAILPVIAKADRAAYVPQAVYFYRQRIRSLSHGTVDYQRLQKNLAASSVMLDKLKSLSPENEGRFRLLKFQCDADALREYLRFNPKAAKGKSKLSILTEAVEASGTYDVIGAMLKRLVE